MEERKGSEGDFGSMRKIQEINDGQLRSYSAINNAELSSNDSPLSRADVKQQRKTEAPVSVDHE